MTGDASAREADAEVDGEPRPADLVGEYDELLATLDVLEKEGLRKVESGRVYDAEAERTRIKWIRIVKDVVAEKRKVSEARDLEELAERIDALETGRGIDR